MFFPSPSTWKMVKDAPNHVPVNMICLAHTSRKILEESDVPIFLVVLITPTHMDHTSVPKSLSHYPPYACRLIQYLYDRTSSAIMRHSSL